MKFNKKLFEKKIDLNQNSIIGGLASGSTCSVWTDGQSDVETYRYNDAGELLDHGTTEGTTLKDPCPN